MGSSTENSAFGIVRNAANPDYVPGGSSGGAVVSVQSGMCHAALGSDTGGSIRQPAAFTGTYGMKPTYGRVSRWGLIAYGSSFDQIGPVTNSIDDTALIMEVIAGSDEYDATASHAPVDAYSNELSFKGAAKIAVLRECYENEGIHKEVKESLDKQIEIFKARGHQVTVVDFPYIDFMIPVYYILTTAEASSNLSRFDGVRYGYRSKNAQSLEAVYKKSRSEGFGPEVQRRIMLGTFVLSEGYYDAYYSKAQKVRRLIMDKTNDILRDHDFILLPSSPTPPFRIGEKSSDPIALYLADIFTAHANIAGIPAISYPSGKTADGLPIGLQLMGKNFSEKSIFGFLKSIES
jgi:aspartyl-tRNA(Asn)/glutamyl-tRNA(Gln) amidotransferase subunit A